MASGRIMLMGLPRQQGFPIRKCIGLLPGQRNDRNKEVTLEQSCSYFQLLYLSNRPQVSMVYTQIYKPRKMLVEREKFVNHKPQGSK